MSRRQDIWNRCHQSIRAHQCSDDSDGFYQTACMRRIGDRYFDTSSLGAAQAIAIENGCPESIVGTHAFYGGSSGDRAATSRAPSSYPTHRTWTDEEMRDLASRINAAVASCFAPEHLPARVMMTVDVHGHVGQHAIDSPHTEEEGGCLARVLVSVDVDAPPVREARTITVRFGEGGHPEPSEDVASQDAGTTE